MVAVKQTSGEIDFPSLAPTCSFVSTQLESLVGSTGDVGIDDRTDLSSWMQAEKMAYVAVVRVLVLKVFHPFLQTSTPTNLEWQKSCFSLFHFLTKSLVRSECFRRIHHVHEEVANDFHVHRGAFAHGIGLAIGMAETVLGGSGRSRHEVSLSIAWVCALHQPIHAELRSLLHHRVNLFEISLVTRESIVFPQMLTEPSTTHVPVCPLRVAIATVAHRIGESPNVGVVVSHPTMCVIEFLRRISSVLLQGWNPFKQWLVHLRKIAWLGRPVVHFRIDIDGVVR